MIGEAENGLEAVNLYQELQPDVMILDLTMPIMDGFQAFDKIITADPSASVVIYSAVQNPEKLKWLKDKGVKAFLQKPLQLSDGTHLELLKNALEQAYSA